MRSFLFVLLLLSARLLPAQPTTRAMKWKSAANINYTYSGEIKNGKPDGIGLAISEDNQRKVFGHFKNGLIDGKAVVFYPGGKITICNWKDGWSEGQGLALTSDKTLLMGNYKRGYLDGWVTEIKADNLINIGDYKTDKFNGRMLSVWADGTTLSDNMMVGGIRQGPGYQFDAEKRKMFEGNWENDAWKEERTDNYSSFMRSSAFGGGMDEKRVIIYSSVDENRLFQDTGYAWIKESDKRLFGVFQKGNLVDGIITTKATGRTIGQFDESGKKSGLCADYEEGGHLSCGNYYRDLLDGEGIEVNFSEGDTVVNMGNFSAGILSGKGIKLSSGNTIISGMYQFGAISSEEIRIVPLSSVQNVTGIKSKQITLSNGQTINDHPADGCTAINFLLKEFDNGFSNISSPKTFNPDDLAEVDPFLTENPTKSYISLYYFPGAIVNKIVQAYKQKNFYFGLAISDDYVSIKKKYDDLCNQLKACAIISLEKNKNIRLVREDHFLDDGRAGYTQFFIKAFEGHARTPKIVIMIDKAVKWQLTVQVTSYQEIE